MSDPRTPRERYDDGLAAIVRLELAGEPVPEAWTARLRELEDYLMALAIFAWGERRGQPTEAVPPPGAGGEIQGELFDSNMGRRSFNV